MAIAFPVKNAGLKRVIKAYPTDFKGDEYRHNELHLAMFHMHRSWSLDYLSVQTPDPMTCSPRLETNLKKCTQQ